MATQENIVTRVTGSGIVKHPDGTQTQLKPGLTVREGDIVITAPDSAATIILAGGAVNCGGANGDAVAIDKTALDFFSDDQDVKVVEATPNEIANDNAIAGLDLNNLEETAAGVTLDSGDSGQNFYVVVQPISTYTAPTPYQNLNSTGIPPVVAQFVPTGIPSVTPLAFLIQQATTPTTSPPEPPPPPPEPVYPTVSVDIEVDPGLEKLEGTWTNADTVSITVTGSDGSIRNFTATINPDGTWTVDLSGVTFDEDVTYTATATATNTYGTATSNDSDVYDIIEPPPPPPPPDPDPEPDNNQNPGNDKDVGNSPWDGETGDSGNPGNGNPQDGVDNDPNNPPGQPDGTNNPTPDPQPEDPPLPPILDDDGGIPLPGDNPGNDKDVGNSPWDGETGSSGQSGNGVPQDEVDTDTNNPPSQQNGTQDSGSSASDPDNNTLTLPDLLDPAPAATPTPAENVMPDKSTTGNGGGTTPSIPSTPDTPSTPVIDDTINQIIRDIANQGKNAARGNH